MRGPHSAAICEKFFVSVPAYGWHGISYDVHSQRAAVAHVVGFVADLLFEDGWEDCVGRREYFMVI